MSDTDFATRSRRDRDEPQLPAAPQLHTALCLKLATRRTATRKLIDVQESSSGGEDGRAERQNAGAYFSHVDHTRPAAVSGICTIAILFPRATLYEETRVPTLHRPMLEHLEHLAAVQQVRV